MPLTVRRWLQRLLGDPSPLPASARDALRGYLQLLDHLRRQIVRVVRTISPGFPCDGPGLTPVLMLAGLLGWKRRIGRR